MDRTPFPLISVVVAVHNGDETLQQCIDSVAQQSYQNKELIIIDGGSTDSTLDILQKNEEKIAYWISEPDSGIYGAWNKALAKAQGEWICFIGADDYLYDSKVIERMAGELVSVSPDIKVAYGKIMLLTGNGERLYTIGDPWEKAAKQFNQVMTIPHPGLMHRRSLFVQNGNFDETFRIAGDYELLLRELKTKDAHYIADVISVAMRQGGVSSNPEYTLIGLRELRLAQKKNGIHRPGMAWLLAVARAYTRLLLWRVCGEKNARKLLDLGRGMMGLPKFWTRT